jgi:hypothetical protein
MMSSLFSQLISNISPAVVRDNGKHCDDHASQGTPQRVAQEVIEKFNESSASIRKLKEQVDNESK